MTEPITGASLNRGITIQVRLTTQVSHKEAPRPEAARHSQDPLGRAGAGFLPQGPGVKSPRL